MSKHILKDVEGFEKRADLFHVDPAAIRVVNGWNDRADFSGEEELTTSIKEVGVKRPLLVKKTKDKTLELIDGERRLRATLRARQEGAAIQTVPVIVAPAKANEIELYLDSIIANTGKPLTPTEEASSFKRLIGWGLSIKDIATKAGRSETHVRNRLELSGATPEVKKAVEEKEITVKDAQEIVRKSDGKVDAQAKALKKKKATPKPAKARPLNLFFKSGSVHYSGGKKQQTCAPLADVMVNSELRARLAAAGYDPESIKISIKPKAKEKDA